MTVREFVRENAAARARLASFVAKASDAVLAREVSGGWTAAGVLGHLAFWDQRIVELIEKWERGGSAPPPHHGDDIDWINDAAKPLLLAVPPRHAAELALAIAEAADRKVAGLSDAMLQQNTSAGHPINVNRAEHRHEHLPELESLLH